MKSTESHLSDQELLLAADGELSARDAGRVQAHLAACWTCRTRKQEIEGAITDFVRVHRRMFDSQLPPADGPRALLKAQVAKLASTEPGRILPWFLLEWQASWRTFAMICGLGILLGGLLLIPKLRMGGQATAPAVSTPNSTLTPGAAVLADTRRVCAEDNTKNRAVPAALRQRVFEAYGISGARPEAYEVDYLITPALGGAEDIHNLWPQSYSSEWNALAKDALEDQLRELVCQGKLDLATAQHEIARDWIAAYKKYLHTETPLEKAQ